MVESRATFFFFSFFFLVSIQLGAQRGMQLFSTQSVGEEINHYTTPGAIAR